MPELGLRDREVAGRGSEHACVWLLAMMSRALNASQAGNERQTSGRGWRVEGIHCLRRVSESSSRGQSEERERERERAASTVSSRTLTSSTISIAGGKPAFSSRFIGVPCIRVRT